jgi:hypothetical protein
LRGYLHGDCLILYAEAEINATIYLLSIRHHRQLSFDFGRLWPGQVGATVQRDRPGGLPLACGHRVLRPCSVTVHRPEPRLRGRGLQAGIAGPQRDGGAFEVDPHLIRQHAVPARELAGLQQEKDAGQRIACGPLVGGLHAGAGTEHFAVPAAFGVRCQAQRCDQLLGARPCRVRRVAGNGSSAGTGTHGRVLLDV